jgi:hypothetical protein
MKGFQRESPNPACRADQRKPLPAGLELTPPPKLRVFANARNFYSER